MAADDLRIATPFTPSPASAAVRPTRRCSVRGAALAVVLALLGGARTAAAEEGRFNLHLDVGAAVLLNDAAARDVSRAGVDLGFKADYAAHRWVAPQLGYQMIYLPGTGGAKAGVHMVTAGARFRVLNDEKGYLANLWPKGPKGNAWGNLYVELGVGYAHAPTRGGSAHWAVLDLAVGYEFSLASPIQLGPYVAYRQLFVKETYPSFLSVGLSISFGYPKHLPKRARKKVAARPVDDPEPPPNIQGRPGDGDGDAVGDALDKCPSTPPMADVDAAGCEPIRGKMVFPGLQFKVGTAELVPGARHEIRRVAEIIQANPTVTVEVGAHTDEPASLEDNLALSLRRAMLVRDELVKHGVPLSRLTLRGYGATAPVDPARTDEARRANRRIEFRFSASQPQ